MKTPGLCSHCALEMHDAATELVFVRQMLQSFAVANILHTQAQLMVTVHASLADPELAGVTAESAEVVRMVGRSNVRGNGGNARRGIRNNSMCHARHVELHGARSR
jgi:hypothetical protein